MNEDIGVTEVSRCSGHCCEKFVLRWNPEELAKVGKDFSEGHTTFGEDQKMDMVAEMVVPIEPEIKDGKPTGFYFYTCKNFDTATRNCTVYESRPPMCSRYPHYGDASRKCENPNCTYTCTIQACKGEKVLGKIETQPMPGGVN
jgi:Fe-S-cluster containining protein